MAQATQQQRESEATGQRQMIPRGLRTDGKCAEGGCMWWAGVIDAARRAAPSCWGSRSRGSGRAKQRCSSSSCGREEVDDGTLVSSTAGSSGESRSGVRRLIPVILPASKQAQARLWAGYTREALARNPCTHAPHTDTAHSLTLPAAQTTTTLLLLSLPPPNSAWLRGSDRVGAPQPECVTACAACWCCLSQANSASQCSLRRRTASDSDWSQWEIR